MTHDTISDLRLRILSDLARHWADQALHLAVAHGTESLPDQLGRDLDVIVNPRHYDLAVGATVGFLQGQGFAVTAHRKPWAHWIVAIRPATHPSQPPLCLEVDLFPLLPYGPAHLAIGASPESDLHHVGPFPVDPWAGFVKRIILQMLGRNFSRFSRRPHELALFPHEQAIVPGRLRSLLTPRLADRILAAIDERDIEALRELRKPLQRHLLFRVPLRHPLAAVVNSFRWFRNKAAINLFLKTSAPIIAILGPDGSGKSTAIKLLAQRLESELIYPSLILRHWRPGLLPDLRHLFSLHRAAPIPDPPPPVSPRTMPGRCSTLRALYYSMDFVFGSWIRDYRPASRMVPILYDRHAVDFLVNPIRYGLSSFPRTLFPLIPQPHLILVLIAPPEIIHARKPELPIPEIHRQIEMWKQLHRAGRVYALIDASGSPDDVADQLFDHLINHLTRRALATRMPNPGNSDQAAGG